MRFNPLPFEFLQIFDLDVAQVAVDVDDDGDGHGGLRSTDSDGEQGEEHSFQFVGEEVAVEHGEVDIDGVQNQFHTN